MNDTVKRDETGAILLLALVFSVVIALILLALVTLAGNDLLNTTNLKSQRNVEYAADGATTAAVQAVRNSYLAYNDQPGLGVKGALCTPVGPTPPGNSVPMTQVNGKPMIVDCAIQAYNPPGPTASAQTRVVNFYTCSGTNTSANACTTTNAIIQAQVTFDDYAPSGGYDCSGLGHTTTCGSAESIDTWVVETANS
jgi:hypothetical protein